MRTRPNPTTPHAGEPLTSTTTRAAPQPVSGPSIPAAERQEDLLRAAFRDVHGARLYGFALLVTLGDRRAAAAAASEALAAGAARARELRHPERAAAWLRRHVVRGLERRRVRGPRDLGALGSLGADPVVIGALAALPLAERAALVATAVEGLEPIDLEIVLGASPSATRRTLARARDGYLAAAVETIARSATWPAPGALTAAVLRVAGETMGGGLPARLSGRDAP